MSDLENKKKEDALEKRPYNLREKKRRKKAAYRSLIRPELADSLYDQIMDVIVVQKRYRDPDYSAKDLAQELQTNTRYLSAVVNSRFGMNYSTLLNEYRVKDALHLLTDKRFSDHTIEEISAMVGFANRQSFYAAFYRSIGETPNGYRRRHAAKKEQRERELLEQKVKRAKALKAARKAKALAAAKEARAAAREARAAARTAEREAAKLAMREAKELIAKELAAQEAAEIAQKAAEKKAAQKGKKDK